MQAMTKTEANERTAYYASQVLAYQAAGADHATAVRRALADAKSYDVQPDEDYDDGAAYAEQAYERWLEDRGADEAAAQDAYEASYGAVDFITAWQLASPETAPWS